MSCPVPLAPDTVVCGHGGSCVPAENRCACADGWSGKGDFVFGEPSCNIYLPAVRYLWIPALVLGSLVFLVALQHLIRLVAKVNRSNFQSMKTALSLGILNVIFNAFLTVTAALKIDDPSRTIGSNVAVTVCFSIAGVALYNFFFLVVILLLEVNFKNLRIREAEVRDRLRERFRKFKLYCRIVALLTSIWMIIPLFMLAISSQEAMFGLALTHFAGAGVFMIVFGHITIPSLVRPLKRDLDTLIMGMADVAQASKEIPKLRSFQERMARISKEAKRQTYTNSPPAFLFAFWPFLQSCSSYFLPITWASGSFACLMLIFVTSSSNYKNVLCCFGTQNDQSTLSKDKSSSAANQRNKDEGESARQLTAVETNTQAELTAGFSGRSL